MPRTLQPCGTEPAYQRHRVHGEQACDACKAAHAAHNRAYQNAVHRARQRLVDENRARYVALLGEELERSGLTFRRDGREQRSLIQETVHVLACAMGAGRDAAC